MKKNIYIALVVLVCLVAVVTVIVLMAKNKKSSSLNMPSPPPEQITKELSAEELPSVRLIPRSDKREVTLEIKNLKDVESLDYELTYLTKDGRTQGAVGSANLSGQTSFSKKILLGTCSRNVCRYDEGVKNGSLLLRLYGEEGVIKITAHFDLDSKDYTLKLQGWLTK